MKSSSAAGATLGEGYENTEVWDMHEVRRDYVPTAERFLGNRYIPYSTTDVLNDSTGQVIAKHYTSSDTIGNFLSSEGSKLVRDGIPMGHEVTELHLEINEYGGVHVTGEARSAFNGEVTNISETWTVRQLREEFAVF